MNLPIRDAHVVDISGWSEYRKYSFAFAFYDLNENYYKNRLLLAIL